MFEQGKISEDDRMKLKGKLDSFFPQVFLLFSLRIADGRRQHAFCYNRSLRGRGGIDGGSCEVLEVGRRVWS